MIAPRSNDQLAEAFENWLRALNFSPSVVTRYPRTVRQFAATLGGRSVLDAERSDVRAFGANRHSVFCRAEAVRALRRFYDFLALGDLTRRNVAREVAIPKLPPPKIPLVPSPEEMREFLDGIGKHGNGEKD
jgi:site-specific recombinase XerD